MWTMAFKTAEYPHGSFMAGQKFTVFGHEHTVERVIEFPDKPKYYVQFDGECHRDDGKQMDVLRTLVPDNVDELEPVELDARTLESLGKAIRAQRAQ